MVIPLNGRRVDSSSPWLSFEGNPLTYIDWDLGEPGPTDTIMSLSLSGPFMLGSETSDQYDGYISEIP